MAGDCCRGFAKRTNRNQEDDEAGACHLVNNKHEFLHRDLPSGARRAEELPEMQRQVSVPRTMTQHPPMLVAASYNERYLKEMEKRFQLEIAVN